MLNSISKMLKIMKRKLVILSLASLSITMSCKDFVSKDDVSPNEPSVATLGTLLPVIEVSLFSSYTGSLSRNSSMFIQHTAGIAFQSNDYNRYLLTETDISNDWTTLYNAGFVNCNDLIQRAGSANPYYSGIAKISKAMILGIATDCWGDIPNREAGKGQDNLSPKYDSQELVIQDIQTLLSDAISDLKKPQGDNALLPGDDDFIFGGNPQSWIKSAYILKARYANRLSKRDPSGSATLALQYSDSAASYSSGSDMKAIFSSKSNELNQWFAFNSERENYMKMSATLMDTLRSLSDPRLSIYAGKDDNGDYTGVPNGGTSSSNSYLGLKFAAEDAKLPMVTEFEVKFIEAEAALRSGNTSRAKLAYEAAIRTNLTGLGVESADIDAYLAGPAAFNNEASTSELQALIMFQKWIAMFTQPEAWTDWRRTNLPALTPNPDGVLNQIPRRYPTEQRERNNNPNATVISDLTTKVWWDN
ncbi:MAG TPA: SusD/RagB family nutrient-binding outer membrane lipoprotein [Catalimonadaceae bacterium]|nr:SusD/RagB family nutrient-binding outer membrane lipoprotein [Catalimonadaceae bacterium]